MKPSFFKWIQQKGMLFLATTMLLKAFLAPAIFIDFKLNQDYIAKVLCINREKPQLECNGQCILMKKMEQAQDSNSAEQSQSTKPHLLEIFSELSPLFQPLTSPAVQKEFFTYNDGDSFVLFFSIFQPPKIS